MVHVTGTIEQKTIKMVSHIALQYRRLHTINTDRSKHFNRVIHPSSYRDPVVWEKWRHPNIKLEVNSKACRRWRSCNLRRPRTATQSLVGLETDGPVTIPTARRQTWQGRRSWESLACLQLCSRSPVGRWWKPCSYRLAAQWRRSCSQWAPQCAAGVWWVVDHLRQHCSCRALRRALLDPSHTEHIQHE